MSGSSVSVTSTPVVSMAPPTGLRDEFVNASILSSVPEKEMAEQNNNNISGGLRADSDDWTAVRSRRETLYSEDLTAYTQPKTVEPLDLRLKRFCSYYILTKERMTLMLNSFSDELKRGLIAHKAHPTKWIPEECSFKMLDSCISKFPTANETGVFYALDFGGTNFRAVRVRLEGNGKVSTEQAKYSLKYEGPTGRSKGLLDGDATASQLFDHFATRLKLVMHNSGDVTSHTAKDPLKVGFTFSFPCDQPVLDEAILVEWTKGFETGRNTNDPVEGQRIGKLTKEAFKRNHVPAQLVAIANDTTGTLLSCAYQKPKELPDCTIGLILGTGANACYVDPECDKYGYVGKIINVEVGNFNRDLPLSDIDLEIDWHTSNRDRQLFEKMISGAYVGETVRLLVIRVFQHRAPVRAWTPETLSCEDAARIVSDCSTDLSVAAEVLLSKWSVKWGVDDIHSVREICRVVYDRSAACAAVIICALARKTGKLNQGGVTVGVDGSLYVKNPWYAIRVRKYIEMLVGEQQSSCIVCCAGDDGSGKGAAILASTM